MYQVALAAMSTGAALGINAILVESTSVGAVPVLLAAVIFCSWFGGTLSGILCTLACLPIYMMLSPPRWQLSYDDWEDYVRLGQFSLVAAGIIGLDWVRRRALTREHSALKTVQENQERLGLALNAGQMGTWEWDIRSGVVRWSAEVEAIRGNTSGEGFEGTIIQLLEMIHPEDREPLQLAVARNLQAGAPGLDAECRAPTLDRGVVWLKLKGQVIRNAKGSPERVTGVVWDTTKQKLTEQDLRYANEIKDEFLGMVSHELRTPTTTVYSGARVLLNRYEELTDDAKKSVLRDVEHEAQRLELIIENLLALARQEDGHPPEPEPISVWRTTESVVTRMRRLRPHRKFELQREGPSDLASGVPIYLELVLRNVLDNADKYSPQGEPIEVRAGAVNGNIVLTVRDHGPGIPEDETERVFDRFYRSTKVDRNTSGAGIGLSVCRRLLESQGATIEARPAGGGGTELVIAMPRYTDD